MARRIALVVLHEDMLHQSFAAAFLNRIHLPNRLPPRFVHASNKAGLLQRFPEEVRALLAQGAETHLVVLMDADGRPYAENQKLLLKKLTPFEVRALQKPGRWLLICPNYELENWARNLDGWAVNEGRDLTLAYGDDSDCRAAARKLADACMADSAPSGALPSLVDACTMWREYTKRHGF